MASHHDRRTAVSDEQYGSRRANGRGRSRNAILQAAIAEFSERGFDGARMEAIAARAGYNKSLVYRYFTDKKGLFEAVLRCKVEQRTDLAHRMPDELPAILKFWFQQSLSDPEYLRLLMREALNDTGGEVVEETHRRAYYRAHTESIKNLQATGELSDKYDAAHLNLAMTALTTIDANDHTEFARIPCVQTQMERTARAVGRRFEVARLLIANLSGRILHTEGRTYDEIATHSSNFHPGGISRVSRD